MVQYSCPNGKQFGTGIYSAIGIIVMGGITCGAVQSGISHRLISQKMGGDLDDLKFPGQIPRRDAGSSVSQLAIGDPWKNIMIPKDMPSREWENLVTAALINASVWTVTSWAFVFMFGGLAASARIAKCTGVLIGYLARKGAQMISNATKWAGKMRGMTYDGEADKYMNGGNNTKFHVFQQKIVKNSKQCRNLVSRSAEARQAEEWELTLHNAHAQNRRNLLKRKQPRCFHRRGCRKRMWQKSYKIPTAIRHDAPIRDRLQTRYRMRTEDTVSAQGKNGTKRKLGRNPAPNGVNSPSSKLPTGYRKNWHGSSTNGRQLCGCPAGRSHTAKLLLAACACSLAGTWHEVALSYHVTKHSQNEFHPSSTANHRHARHDPMKARRIGEASHPGPQHQSVDGTSSDDDDGFGQGFADMEREDEVQELDNEAYQQPPDECLSEYSHYADDYLDTHQLGEEPDTSHSDGHTATDENHNNVSPADPLPGHPAGSHLSNTRKASLDTWSVLSQWVKIPTRPARKPRANTVDSNVDPENLVPGEIQEAAKDGAPVIPCSSFMGAVQGYVFAVRKKIIGYHADDKTNSQAHDASGEADTDHRDVPCLRLEDTIPTSNNANAHRRPSKKARKKNARASFTGPLQPAPTTDTTNADWWRHNGLWAIDTINPNSYGAAKHYRQASTADAAIMQETKAYGPTYDNLRADAARNSWGLTATPASKGRGNGRSGGAAVMVRNCYSIEPAPGLRMQSEPHRACFARSSVCGGITIISMYLHHHEGMSPNNKRLLEEMAAEISQINGPWIIGTDANMEPKTLDDSGWPAMINGHICAPDQPTCASSTYDYFIVSKCLQSAVHGIQVIKDAGISPHYPVRLLLHANAARRFRRRLVKPPHIPGKLPMGPKTEEEQGKFNEGMHAYSPQHPTTNAHRAQLWTANIRGIFSSILGRDLGSSDRTSFTWTDDKDLKKTYTSDIAAAAAGWRSIANQTSKLASAMRKQRSRAPNDRKNVPLGAMLWDIYQHAHSTFEKHELADTRSEGLRWMKRLLDIRNGANTVIEIPPQDIARHAATAFKIAQGLDDDAAHEKRETFRQWLDEGAVHACKGNKKLPGRAAFQYIRTTHGWASAAKGNSTLNNWQKETSDEEDPHDWESAQPQTTEPTLLHHQAEVELAANEWAKLWQEGQPCFAPPSGPIPSSSPPLTAQDIRTAADTFPHGTGLGADNMSPRAISALPDNLLQEMAEILNECERTGLWPDQWRIAIIVLLPKPDGGRRPIGLFPAPVRIWMRARAPELRKWEQDNSRESLYGSSGKAATRAAWLSAWEAENAGKGEGAYAQALMDLVKAFESVPHRQLWEAAEKRGYPMATLRLALAAYTMPRSISSDGAFSRLVTASRGITAGSGTATAELRALTLDLIDALAEEFPEIVQAVYVDDVNLELRNDADNTRFPRPAKFLPHYFAKKLAITRARHMTNIITNTTNTVAKERPVQ